MGALIGLNIGLTCSRELKRMKHEDSRGDTGGENEKMAVLMATEDHSCIVTCKSDRTTDLINIYTTDLTGVRQ